MAFFLFLYFLFPFFTKIYFRLGNLQKYTPAVPLPGGRVLAARQRGGRGISGKKSRRKLRAGPWGPVARQRGGRPWPPGCRATGSPGRPAVGRPALPPLYKGWLVPPPLICITKIPETKKRGREGEREAKPYRIFEPATAGNQNSSTLYK